MQATARDTRSDEFKKVLAGTLRKAGLRVKRAGSSGKEGADLVFEKDGVVYPVQLGISSEGRSDRLIPLLSQAILQTRAYAKKGGGTIPLAVVAAPRIPAPVVSQIQEFARRYAPEVAVGAIDSEGLRSFIGFGLEKLNARPSRSGALAIARSTRLPDLFSDLNQWMLKILIGQHLPETLIAVPRDPVRNASQLANAAGVSVMSASRFVKQLSERGFLHKDDDLLQIARVEDLLDLWISANRGAVDEIPARWIIKKGPDQLTRALRKYTAENQARNAPECCLALFAAADALGCGFVHGVPPHIYIESLSLDALKRLGLSVDGSGRPPDVFIRRPLFRTAVFRARIIRDGVPVSDILQVWLDASAHPARGKEQAREIWRRVLKPLLGKA
jgi:hypothetical protein